MKRLPVFFFILLIISFSSAFLGADITATYEPDPHLVFTTGNSPFDSSDFIAHLGTLTFQSSENTFFSPYLIDLNMNNHFTVIGPTTWNPDKEDQDTSGCIVAVIQYNGIKQITNIWGNGGRDYQPLLETNGNLKTSRIVSDFYLLSDQPASVFIQGSSYRLISGSLGTFNAGATTNNGQNITKSLFYIKINSQTLPSNGSAPYPAIPINTNIAAPIPYPGKPDPVGYLFSIISEEYFDVENAIGLNPTKVGTARLVLCNPCASTSYGVDVKFTDSNNGTDFSLGLDGSKSVYTIGYSLRFQSSDVKVTNPIPWDNLHEGINDQNIYVTGIDATKAELAPSGDYSDTITVTITPKDTH
ncbi:hypothetical protein SpiGrapes_0695 [Sphaerochaeta pleomorpha str. Grapes]|uniref:Uncharacterized protein n=1 Tax=Sphaerochaeta pleomorpha (strain ATCC BAA-1885 / DSM 22778 / Grapes) TaxID=158190 RepID=G8QY31_SPHPG|nr:hypothetical protein [Sphaerochaeta pleomorpha]AEV28536.1 hypothetical protein SpiGrapes_0695 [Sphaerochaeta pleomorpha str. Grapes]